MAAIRFFSVAINGDNYSGFGQRVRPIELVPMLGAERASLTSSFRGLKGRSPKLGKVAGDRIKNLCGQAPSPVRAAGTTNSL